MSISFIESYKHQTNNTAQETHHYMLNRLFIRGGIKYETNICVVLLE